MPNDYPAGQPAGTGAFPPNRLYELSEGYVTGQRVMSLPLGDVGSSQVFTTEAYRTASYRLDAVFKTPCWPEAGEAGRGRPLGAKAGPG